MLPTLVLWARGPVPAGGELTLDYGGDSEGADGLSGGSEGGGEGCDRSGHGDGVGAGVGGPPASQEASPAGSARVACRCRAPNCRGFLPYCP